MRTSVYLTAAAALAGALVAAAACGDDGGALRPLVLGGDGAQGGGGGGVAGEGGAGGASPQVVARGEYLVKSVLACGDCHTPRGADGAPDATKFLAGNPCFVDAVPDVDGLGCVASQNLTDHPTGLANLSDAQIKEAMLDGVGAEGKALLPAMPYPIFHNMKADDADAIVAYLRTVPGVDFRTPKSQPPVDGAVTTPSAPVDPATIPGPDPSYPDQASALRGRYLAAELGACIDCHTPALGIGLELDRTKFMQGGRAFAARGFGLAAPPLPATIYSSNLTPDDTGIKGYTVAQLVDALKQGVDKESKALCPPMPAGAGSPYAGLTDADAADIAHYLLSLRPAVTPLPNACEGPAGAPAAAPSGANVPFARPSH